MLPMVTVGVEKVSTSVSATVPALFVARMPTAPMKQALGAVPDIGVAVPVSSDQLPSMAVATEYVTASVRSPSLPGSSCTITKPPAFAEPPELLGVVSLPLAGAPPVMSTLTTGALVTLSSLLVVSLSGTPLRVMVAVTELVVPATKGESVPLLGTALPRSMLQVLPLGASVYVAPPTVTVSTSPSVLHQVPVITGVVSLVLSEVTVGRFSAVAVVLLPAASVAVAVILL